MNRFDTRNETRAVRGAGWFNSARACRAFQRDGWLPTNRGRYVGLRVLGGPTAWIEADSHFDAAQAETPMSLHAALAAGDLSAAAALVQADPGIVSSPDEIPPPLHWTIYQQQPQMAAWLIDRGADLSLEDPDHGTSPLVCATIMGQREIMEFLVAAGAPTAGARDAAERGLRGEFEDVGLPSSPFAQTLELLARLGVK